LFRRWAALAAALLLAALPDTARACATCFGKSDDAMARGMNAGIFALLFVVVCVLAAFAAFALFLVRRSAALERAAASPASLAPPNP
jgi:hypothetical protein